MISQEALNQAKQAYDIEAASHTEGYLLPGSDRSS